ncbi:hypothetical protein ALC56_10345 [Trachymyrmex septentrionalis]|uniref:Uncharacterized protein n=1 Tax=Trachymyrmex septentrionalis TaxID=34720 RepID=A0A195F454_9HYME|nr:hypothetical protein ALC56_10345 [Trachymyrmex septentrionalis]
MVGRRRLCACTYKTYAHAIDNQLIRKQKRSQDGSKVKLTCPAVSGSKNRARAWKGGETERKKKSAGLQIE